MKATISTILIALVLFGCSSNDSTSGNALSYDDLLKEKKSIQADIESLESSKMLDFIEIQIGEENDSYLGTKFLLKNNAVEASFKDFVIVTEFLTESKTIVDRDTNILYSIIKPGDSLTKHFEFRPDEIRRSVKLKLIKATFVPNNDLPAQYEFVSVE